MSDIVENLRATADDTDAVENASVAHLLEEAAAEIERLRLTAAEREAIRLGELAYPGLRITDHGQWVDVWAVLRGLTARNDAS